MAESAIRHGGVGNTPVEQQHRSSAPHIVVVGAGAFGGWIALALVRRGMRVTLVDGWGPGNSRSSSGDETRLIRAMYNGDPIYTEMAARAFGLWREAETRWGTRVLRETGVLYLFAGDDAFARTSVPLMKDFGVAVEELSPIAAAKRFNQFNFDDVRSVFFESRAGVLLARRACELVRESVEREGGTYRQAHASPGAIHSGRVVDVALSDGTTLEADAFVFACGPWLGQVFPDVIGEGITPTRQSVVYVGTPTGYAHFHWKACPGWIDFGEGRRYGMPGERGDFKIGDDLPGPAIDPTTVNRIVPAEELQRTLEFVRRRFPILSSQPIVEARVCQYECSPTNDFLLDTHPGANNLWIAGGGSGHGFKMGPAVGDYVARLILDAAKPDPRFTFAAFSAARARLDPTKPRVMHS